MILGINDMEEDYQAMKQGIESGIISPQRLQDALERILACKAAIGLHKKKQNHQFYAGKEAQVIGCPEHQEIARKAAAKAVTLVKNTKGQIPLLPERYKKIGVFVFLGMSETREVFTARACSQEEAALQRGIFWKH